MVEANGREYRIWIQADTGYDIGITASKPITANARTSLTWSSSAALCDVTAARGLCQGRIAMTPSGPKVADPFGSLDGVKAAADRTVTVNGWAIDPDTNDPIAVHVYLDGAYAAAVSANQSRPDVGSAVPGYGDLHGYRTVLSGVTPGAHQVCTYAINVGPYGTTNPQLGCASVTVPGDPFGNLESATPVPAGARVTGWAIDPDTSAPLDVHVYVDGTWAGAVTASAQRGDIAAVYPWAGAAHGYDTVVPSAGGSHQVCAYGINVGPTGTQNVKLGCATVVVDGSPLGSLDAAVATAGGVSVRGWAFDPDTSAATVQVRIDGGAPVAVPTTVTRSDVGAVFPGRGDSHGFEALVPAAPGTRQVCASVPNEGSTGTTLSLGCRTITVLGGVPFGNVDAVTRGAGTARIEGWSIDPDITGPVQVHVYVNGAWAGAASADALRSDVGFAYPGYGIGHGIDLTVAVPAGTADVCVYAIDVVSARANPLLGCRRV